MTSRLAPWLACALVAVSAGGCGGSSSARKNGHPDAATDGKAQEAAPPDAAGDSATDAPAESSVDGGADAAADAGDASNTNDASDASNTNDASDASNTNDASDASNTNDASDASASDAGDGGVADADANTIPDGCAANSTPATTTVQCFGYSVSHYTPPYVCQPELFFASNYEASSDHTKPYPATVDFNVPGVTGAVLVLSSYEQVTWTVNVGASSSLSKVIVLGYRTSTVVVPNGVTVDNQSPFSSYYCHYNVSPTDPCVPYARWLNGGSGEVASMAGCYNAISFTIQ